MKLRDVRKIGIKYCEENKCNYAYISHNEVDEFYLTDKENSETVFFIGKNGSLKACLTTSYAIGFHKELKRRKNRRKRNYKRKLAEICNHVEESED